MFRNDVEGLRSLAIVPIVLFHMGLESLSGGFIGVDIFFVISGYLISTTLTQSIESSVFSYREFYARRIRRLGPALLFVLFGCFVFAYLLFFRGSFVDFASSVVATIFSTANIFFWLQLGYFDGAAISKPLLHMWSLAVEEQFYLVWPLLLSVFYKLTNGRKPKVGVAALGLIGLVAAQWCLHYSPDAVFFLMPFRICELSLGAYIAVAGVQISNRRIANAIALLSVVGILLCCLLYTENTPFPGLAAMLPAACTALLIVTGPETIAARFLSLGVLRYLGKISYSLYLVHWPLIVFYTFRFGAVRDLQKVFGLSLLAILLGSLTYHFVETPFRSKRKGTADFRFSANQLYLTCGAASLLLIALATVAYLGIWVPRTPPDLEQITELVQQANSKRDTLIRFKTCHASRLSEKAYLERWAQSDCQPQSAGKHLAIVGDSHAADVWSAINRSDVDMQPYQFTGGGCSWFNTFAESTEHCEYLFRHQKTWFKSPAAKNVTRIIYSQRGMHFIEGDPDRSDPLRVKSVTGIRIALEQLAKDAGVPVVFWGPRPEYHPSVPQVLAQSHSLADMERRIDQQNWRIYFDLDRALAREFEGSSVRYVSVVALLCRAGSCPLLTPAKLPMVYDSSHWTIAGGDDVVQRMREHYPEIFER
jgi:peptidoglycan/LPS O-acetylase OafA/YrhL